MIGCLVRGRVRITIRIRIRVGVLFNVSVYHWSNCRRSKCHTYSLQIIKPREIICFPLQFLIHMYTTHTNQDHIYLENQIITSAETSRLFFAALHRSGTGVLISWNLKIEIKIIWGFRLRCSRRRIVI